MGENATASPSAGARRGPLTMPRAQSPRPATAGTARRRGAPPCPGEAETRAPLPQSTGKIEKVPPAYSAIHVDGERAYDLARAGEAVELKARPVVIHSAQVADAPDADHVTIEIECGKGPYVRALVRDLAEGLGACGHVSDL